MFKRPVIVISKCIEHGHCRFDGSMISSTEVKDLKKWVDFIVYCPEMAIGLPSPRESLRLIRRGSETLLIQNKSGLDKTKDMLTFAASVEEELRNLSVDGFILKSRSPSCGIKDVKLYSSIDKAPTIGKIAKGIFAEAMMEFFPNAVFEDEGRLTNFSLREHFLTVIFTKADFKEVKTSFSMKGLIDFHAKNKYLFMAYSQKQAQILGRIVANHQHLVGNVLIEEYEKELNKLLLTKPKKGQIINVLLHIFGYFSNELVALEKAHFIDALKDYRENHIPQSTLMLMLYSWSLRFEHPYLLGQTIFEPFPKELIHMADSGKGF
jgi:uncharacterized protein YbgA (DUF1722 family)/uncharacterized protein YbbK (DUF523 family)